MPALRKYFETEATVTSAAVRPEPSVDAVHGRHR